MRQCFCETCIAAGSAGRSLQIRSVTTSSHDGEAGRTRWSHARPSAGVATAEKLLAEISGVLLRDHKSFMTEYSCVRLSCNERLSTPCVRISYASANARAGLIGGQTPNLRTGVIHGGRSSRARPSFRSAHHRFLGTQHPLVLHRVSSWPSTLIGERQVSHLSLAQRARYVYFRWRN